MIRKPIEVARKLSNIIGINHSEILSKLGNRASGVKIIEGIDDETAYEIRKLGISGLDIEPYPQRVYPQNDLFANVIGFLNLDRVPQAGLEQSLNKKLLRNEKPHVLRRGADGTPLPYNLTPGLFDGDDLKLQLTVDIRLQEIASNALKDGVSKWNAKKGVAIVMDVNNGEILTLSSTPSYNPNEYWNYSPSLFREWSVQDLFEPGSTFKPINLALALEEGVVNSNQIVNDTGKIIIGGWSIYNHDSQPNGKINLAKVLQVSSNVGMVKVMSRFHPNNYWDWLHRIGINVTPYTDLPGAVAGQLKSKEDFVSKPIELATASYGQGFSLTPLKLAQLHALIANGGYLVRPRITRGLQSGDTLLPPNDPSRNKILKTEVTQKVLSWMESVVDEGSGIGVKTSGFRIGGKTGTAEKAIRGSYQSGVKICSFVAAFPIDKPKYVVLVVVDEPKGGNAYGSTVAVPIVKKIIDGLLVLEKIPPVNAIRDLQPSKG